ncbi:N-acetyl-alpha-D-glucosaminyl L-malate synthase BshA [Aneurinibacillus soli]|uniref:GDP-mannose-dependent alpha-(1-6)-phosphatidylinositol monomannoside mannosyltransferase n=1 Tax=Aneurinibacillus soli TaxID=1500254 RepID=A0A0U5BL00_9BACL|nr:N-acetyl-alpha-D-glucosaminyl L-malate synthase BshA [Aneurinibacillus soli]PYE63080.1 N-acetyl-alpha-D-glucosaminyl L-malate synthase BshA [Aneurinibacillus soli]BAU28862.1 GDP-mannose-dependent alpha-(1-6)-phosphatidylinositol monomannoside mannosyltransferase [Aneurinibacillus soli]
MRIGITCYPSVGGSGILATELGKLLAERGHTVHFITSGMPFRLGKYYRNIYFHEVDVSSYSVFQYPPYDLTLASRMAEVAKTEKLDLLHVHYAVPHAISAYLAKQMVGDQLKVVTTLHGTDITVLGYDHTLKDIIRFGIEQSDAVTAVSNSLIQQTRDALQVDKPIDLVYNFIDNREYYPRNMCDVREEYAPNGEKVFIHISNFRTVKRPEDVIHTFRRIRQRIPAKLLMIGEGPELPIVRDLTDTFGLGEDVIYLGKQEDIACVLSMADVLLLPSAQESFGLVALEAMACGKPVISSDAGGLPEVVLDGETGFVLPIGDVDGMAARAVQLVSDPGLYEKFARQSIERAYHTFCHTTITEQYEAIYRRVLEEDGTAGGLN